MSAEFCPVCLSMHDLPSGPLTVFRANHFMINNLPDLSLLAKWAVKCPFLYQEVMWHFREKVDNFLQRRGISSPRRFLDFISTHSFLVAGPDLATSLVGLDPSPSGPKRLEIHAPNSDTAVHLLVNLLYREGFRLVHTFEKQTSIIKYASECLQYIEYGSFLKMLGHYAKLDSATYEVTEVYLMVNVSKTSSLPSVVGYPTTFFMVTLSGNELSILYPALTCLRRGLINLPSRSRAFPPYLVAFCESGVDLQYRLEHWAENGSHACGHDGSCPSRLRDRFDGLSLTFAIRPSSSGAQGRYLSRHDAFFAWRLRGAWSCEFTMPNYVQDSCRRGICISDIIEADPF
ncbi:hypothetical protein BKA70DRAFT_1444402 [Coprinopsis sp. MPI-PUGE-AT-0042]|nr:hypothetical protein BKA70DRAFT_1444402 [Coprinopsis sp. MPI-PUGE-AT-0042]